MSDVTGSSLLSGTQTKVVSEAFNLRDEKSVVTLLRRIHQSPLLPENKNKLRDAVFLFRSSIESSLTDELKSQFSQSGFAIEDSPVPLEVSREVPVAPVVEKTRTGFGSARPRPRFAPVSISKIPPVDTPSIDDVSVTSPVTEPVVAQVASAHVPPQPVEIPVEIPVVAEPMVKPPTETQSAPTSSNGERIKEIKKEVNQLVGNPVNLIDVHNDLGREYMSALLDAMKKGNGGTPEEVASAMERLELAFASVKKTINSNDTIVDKTPEVAPEPESVAEVSGHQEIPDAVVGTVPPDAIENDQSETASPEEMSVPVSGFASVHDTHIQNQTPINESSVIPLEEVPPVHEAASVEANSAVPPNTVQQTTPPVTSPESVIQENIPNASGGIMSVAKEKQIQDLLTAQKQEAAVTDQQKRTIEIAAMDPLMTPEVTAGLQQLLSEWSLFKSTSFFSKGSKGMEHPLFKKLATLNMTAVVAGRFEGATPQIKRSISDYMNGWRYEEGILQQQGELFEHYLRRVIKHIIDKRSTHSSEIENK